MSMNRSMEPSRPLEPDYGRRMTNAEAVMLCRYARAACPQQKFDEYTPDAWADLLTDLRYVDCQAALKEIVKRQPFVSPSEIRTEVTRVRNKRIGEFGPTPAPPPELSPAEQIQWTRDLIRRIADGEPIEKPRELESPHREVDYGALMAADPTTRQQAIAAARAAITPRSATHDR